MAETIGCGLKCNRLINPIFTSSSGHVMMHPNKNIGGAYMQEANHPVAPDHQQLRQTWKAHIERWKDSGQTQSAFCLQYGLKPHQFTYWKKRFIQANTGISFVPLHFCRNLPVAVTGSTFNLFTQNGFKIEVGTGFDPATLKQLICTVQSL